MRSCLTYSLIELDANSLVGIPKKIRSRVKRMDFAVQSKLTLAAIYLEASCRIGRRRSAQRRGHL
jgi:hypothetical protein